MYCAALADTKQSFTFEAKFIALITSIGLCSLRGMHKVDFLAPDARFLIWYKTRLKGSLTGVFVYTKTLLACSMLHAQLSHFR